VEGSRTVVGGEVISLDVIRFF